MSRSSPPLPVIASLPPRPSIRSSEPVPTSWLAFSSPLMVAASAGAASTSVSIAVATARGLFTGGTLAHGMRCAARPLAVLVLAATVLAVAPSGADAAISRKKAIWGPVRVDGVSQFPIYADLGAGIYQYAVRWDAVAPTEPAHPADPSDPAYHWPAEVDDAIAEARRHGIRVAIML